MWLQGKERKNGYYYYIYEKIRSEMSAVVIMLMANIFHCSKVTNAVADALRTENFGSWKYK